MRLNYRNAEIHPDPQGRGIASIAHVFTDAHSPWVFAYCEMRDGTSFWAHKYEDQGTAPLNLMFAMQPPEPWLQAVNSIPAGRRMAALQPAQHAAKTNANGNTNGNTEQGGAV